MTATPDPATAPAVDLEALDHCLSPLRRVLRYAQRGSARYLDVIGLRWRARARAVSLPQGVDGILAEAVEALQGLGELSAEEQELRVLAAASAVRRVDQLLGLPLPVAVPVGDDSDDDSDNDDDEDASDEADSSSRQARGSSTRKGSGRSRRGRKKRGRGRKKRSSDRSSSRRSSSGRSSGSKDASPAQDSADEESLRYGGEQLAGRDLSDLHGSDALLPALDKAGIRTVDALLQRAPTGEDVVQPVVGAGRLREEGRTAVGGRVRLRHTHLHPDGSRDSHVLLRGAGLTPVCWSGGAPSWLIEQLELGSRTVLVGQAVTQDAGLVLTQAEPGSDDGKHAVRLATYGVPDVPDAQVRSLVRQVLPAVARVQDPLPPSLREARGLLPLSDALTRAHTQGRRAGAARERLTYDEALLAQLALLWPRYQGTPERGLSHTLLHGLPSRVLQHVEAQLTDEQQVAFEEVKRDLRAPTPMRRVLTGEVGAGKGLVALLSAVLVAENKHQVLILAPDQATAEQRYAFTEPLLRELGLVARLYTEPPSRAQRDAIKRGEVHVLFGAIDLLESELDCRRLGLIIAGEREVFGRVPELVQTLRSPRPDLLIITSTPVAQQVLLAAYPTFDHTVLRHLPGHPVPARVVEAEHRGTAYGAAAEAVERNEQVAVVFPMSRGADVLDVREALHVVSTLEASVFPGKRVKLFHGAMGRDERYRVYNDFRDHRIDVLVATTHFEAGPAVHGVSTVIIEQADRMRLSRLHRVREHISVSRHEPRCWLITGETPDEAGLARVERFAGASDGFTVAAQEFEVRGLDDMISATPESLPTFTWLDPATDIDTLVQARSDARALLERDPGLRKGTNLELARYLRARWEAILGTDCPVPVSASGSSRRRRRRRRR